MPTKRCNLRCAICWQRLHGTDPDEINDDDRWRRLVDESADLGVRMWNLTGGGEPMVRGELILDLCGRILERGMTGVLQTNGTLFRPEHVARLTEMRWPRLLISLDGPDAAINDAIRSAGAFDKIMQTLALFREEKAKRRPELPAITIHTVMTSLNYRSLDKIAELAASHGCETLDVSRLMIYGSECRELEITPESAPDFEEQVAAAAVRADALGLHHNLRAYVSAPAATAPAATAAALQAHQAGGLDLSRVQCFEPWLSVTVHTHGRVGPCCIFSDSGQPNILEYSLHDIWLGPYFQRLRGLFRGGALRPECRDCLSNILARNEAFRQRLLLDALPAHRRLPMLARKALAAVRQHGLRRAWERAREWTRVGRDW